MFLTSKTANNGAGRLYQIHGRGPWRSERNTDSLLASGKYPIIVADRVVGRWVQKTLGHRLETV